MRLARVFVETDKLAVLGRVCHLVNDDVRCQRLRRRGKSRRSDDSFRANSRVCVAGVANACSDQERVRKRKTHSATGCTTEVELGLPQNPARVERTFLKIPDEENGHPDSFLKTIDFQQGFEAQPANEVSNSVSGSWATHLRQDTGSISPTLEGARCYGCPVLARRSQ